MRLFIPTLLALILWCGGLLAQNFTAGPVVGLNYARIEMDQHFMINNEEHTFEYVSPGFGPAIGAYASLQWGKFSMLSQLRLARERSIVSLRNWETSLLQTYSATRIQIPLVIGYQVSDLRLFAGPMLGQLLDASMVPSNEDRFALYQGPNQTTSLGYQVGVGFQFQKAMISFQLTGNLTNQGIHFSYQDQSVNTNQQVQSFLVSFSYQIFEAKPKEKPEDLILPPTIVVSEE